MSHSDEVERGIRRFLALMAIGFTALAGFILVRDVSLYLALERRGVKTEAEITRVWEKVTRNGRYPSGRSLQVDYKFKTLTGRVVQSTRPHPGRFSQSLKRGMTGSVTYLPDDPRRNRFALVSPRMPFLFSGIALFVALIFAYPLFAHDPKANR